MAACSFMLLDDRSLTLSRCETAPRGRAAGSALEARGRADERSRRAADGAGERARGVSELMRVAVVAVAVAAAVGAARGGFCDGASSLSAPNGRRKRAWSVHRAVRRCTSSFSGELPLVDRCFA
jgi:hypothetical protein